MSGTAFENPSLADVVAEAAKTPEIRRILTALLSGALHGWGEKGVIRPELARHAGRILAKTRSISGKPAGQPDLVELLQHPEVVAYIRNQLPALTRRLLEPKVWLRLPAVMQVVMENVETDMTTQDLLLLAPTLLRVGPDGIEQHVIGREMTEPWTTPTGGAVLLPRWEAIHPLVQDLFTP